MLANPTLHRPELPAEALLSELPPQLGGITAAFAPASTEVVSMPIDAAAARLLAPHR
jgi:hypothetical protein